MRRSLLTMTIEPTGNGASSAICSALVWSGTSGRAGFCGLAWAELVWAKPFVVSPVVVNPAIANARAIPPAAALE